MKSDFLLAITQLSAEKNLPKEVVLATVESALVSAYRKESFAPNQNIAVKIDQLTGKVKVMAEKLVVEKVTDSRQEMRLLEAKRLKADAKIGDLMMVEDTPADAGRIAAQTAKQVILQRLHEAENTAIFDEYASKAGDTLVGVVQRIEPKQITVDIGRVEAIMPASEQAYGERYRAGQRIKVYVVDVAKTAKGPAVIVSRSHPGLVRRLFEMEVPEVFNQLVEIKAVAREAGSRSKVAVGALQPGIDPVGCCVGLRGIRIQNIVSELNGEKIDVVAWDSEIANFIANSLSPAQVTKVILNEAEKSAIVVIPDRQLSLGIGKEGQNVRLAVKLTGWRIDIKSASDEEVERAEETARKQGETEKPAITEKVIEKQPAAAPAAKAEAEPIEPVMPEAIIAEPAVKETPAKTEAVPEEQGVVVPLNVLDKVAEGDTVKLRFAEDLLPRREIVIDDKNKGKNKKKTVKGKDTAEDGIKLKGKKRRNVTDYESEEIDF
ncbi:transcription termination factor NusA [Dehalococcoides mccartyi]|uniref:Transcription termination/antitermination protein NusA n=1 Tax=Dehalococcoides mccartyi (strain ATCC BAA-2266 / KCTC 15142 / 195) TaxID=243164 RepID=Q3Z7U1_DEHM1|nr:transcription termination factor NusA [Dehalococcoides mccartyi]AAW39789.1 N utilization substance protein A [Dehalococcoides mccartyi 195]